MISVPTDSFYKFIAISGLFLVGLIFWVNGNVYVEFKKIDELTNRDSLMSHMFLYRKDLEHQIKRLEKSLIEHKHGIKESSDYQKKIDLITLEITHKQQDLTGVSERISKLPKHEDSLILKYASGWVVYLWQAISLFMFMSGLLMSTLGFRNWYKRHQHPNDELLQLQVEKAKKEISNKSINYAPYRRRTR